MFFSKISHGNGLLELIISLAMIMIFLGVTFPLWGTLFQKLSVIRLSLRQATHLNWLADHLCDDIQFGGNPSVLGSKLTISGNPTITYQRIGRTLRRTSGQSTQTLSTFPVTGWTVSEINTQISFHIAMSSASVNRICSPW